MEKTPTDTPTGPLAWVRSVLSHGTKDSSRRVIAAASAVALILCLLALTGAIVWQAAHYRAVDNALATAFGAIAAFVAALAREIYRSKNDPVGQ